MRGYHKENRRRIREYLESRGCVDCGESDRRVLDFDHRDPRSKVGGIARLAMTKPWPVVLSEIEKCDVRCANCHRRRTALQFDWLKRRRGLPSGS